MADPAQLPDARRAQALATIKQREDGIRAAATKAGYAKRDAEWCAKLGVESVDQALQINQLRAERDARPTAEEERKHAVGNRWRGRTEGVIAGMVVAMGIMLFVVAKMNEQTRASTEAGVMIGTAATSQSGEPLVSPNYNRDYPRAPREPGDAP